MPFLHVIRSQDGGPCLGPLLEFGEETIPRGIEVISDNGRDITVKYPQWIDIREFIQAFMLSRYGDDVKRYNRHLPRFLTDSISCIGWPGIDRMMDLS